MSRRTRARGHIEERANGKFRAVVYAGKDPLTGRDRYLRKQADTEMEAQKVLTSLLKQVDDQRQPRSRITVSQAIEKWFEVAEHEPTTRRRYQQLVRDYVDPSFGSLQAAKLDAELLEQLYSRLQKCRARCGGRPGAGHTCRPLSNSTVRQVHFIIRAALDRAVRWQYIAVNPAALALPPSFKKPTPDPPSAEEIAAVLNEAWKEPAWGLLLWLVMVTGCRRGELCALRWTI